LFKIATDSTPICPVVSGTAAQPPLRALDRLRDRNFEVEFHSHAAPILEVEFPEALRDLSSVLEGVSIPIGEIIGSGGGEAAGTQRMRRALAKLDWIKKKFEIRKTVNGVERESISHEIDHVKTFPAGTLALEIEWNNKDPFFDRDLENMKRLHTENAISAGVIITRGSSLHGSMREFVRRWATEHGVASFEDLERLDVELTRRKKADIAKRAKRVPFIEAFTANFVADKYGEATTHWRKLQDRVHRGVGHPCPLVLIGLPAEVIAFEQTLP